MQRLQKESEKSKERKVKTPSEPLMAQLRPESKMEVDKTPRKNVRFNLDRVAKEQMSEVVETWTPPEPTPSLRDLKLSRTKPLAVDVALHDLTPSSTGGSQISAGVSRPKKLEDRINSRTPENSLSEREPSA